MLRRRGRSAHTRQSLARVVAHGPFLAVSEEMGMPERLRSVPQAAKGRAEGDTPASLKITCPPAFQLPKQAAGPPDVDPELVQVVGLVRFQEIFAVIADLGGQFAK